MGPILSSTQFRQDANILDNNYSYEAIVLSKFAKHVFMKTKPFFSLPFQLAISARVYSSMSIICFRKVKVCFIGKVFLCSALSLRAFEGIEPLGVFSLLTGILGVFPLLTGDLNYFIQKRSYRVFKKLQGCLQLPTWQVKHCLL